MVILMLTHPCASAQSIFFVFHLNSISLPNVGFFPAGLFVVHKKLSHDHDELWPQNDTTHEIGLNTVDTQKGGLSLGREGVGSRVLFMGTLPLATEHSPFFKST